jgi:Heterokaryon incompatibility protein (HET)
MAPKFTYRPLNQDPPEIRLLELKPAAERALSLECTLRHSALSFARYSCLSYVWGDPDKDEKSTIGIAYKKTIGEHFKPKRRRGSESNKYHMKIGSSLAAALRHLRHERNRVTVWADALCINQEDDEEKNWQVPLMMRIYSNATSVHAWLGPRYDESPDVVNSATAAFDLIPIVADLLRRSDCMQRLADETSWSKACFALAEPRRRDVQLFWAAMSKTLRDAMASMGLWDSYLSAFKTLSQVKYFQRMWVREPEVRIR